MDFHNYITLRDFVKRSVPKHSVLLSMKESYQRAIERGYRMGDGRLVAKAKSEQNWEWLKRPYYKVWPGIVPLLTRLKLDIGSDLIHVPMPSLCVCFPKDPTDNPLKFDLMGEQICITAILMGEIGEGGFISLQIQCQPADTVLHPFINFLRKPDVTVQEWLSSMPQIGSNEDTYYVPEKLLTDLVRLCCTLCLLDNDPSVISPDVLADDRMKYEATDDPKYVEKAHRKGKFGWDVGRHIEKIPHVRRPHMALVWTGIGRKVPKVVERKGSIVHRDVVEKIPTGFMGTESQRDIPGQVSSET